MYEITEYIGIIAFVFNGFTTASKNNLDLLGIFVVVFLTALGGGIMRDIAVGVTPYTFTHSVPSLLVFIVLILLILFKVHKRNSIENKPYFIVSDSIGLVAFSITGAIISLEHNLNYTGILMVSFVGAIGGGIIRDIIINEIPFIFKTGFYGTVSLLVATLIYILHYFNILTMINITIIFIIGCTIRVVAYYKKWNLRLK
jgi:uncharacterized membrane protein YeiH